LAVWVRAGQSLPFYYFLFSIFNCRNKIKQCGPVTKAACKSSCIPAALQEEQAAPPLYKKGTFLFSDEKRNWEG
jgi:hypothetical protein